MTIKQAHELLKKEVPAAEYISVGVETNWWPRCGESPELEFTVAVTVQGYRHQRSCVADLDAAVRTILGEINGPDRELVAAAMNEIHDGGDSNPAQFSNDNG